MDPIARIVLIGLGGVIGAVLSGSAARGFGALLGAAMAYVMTEVIALRAQQEKLRDDIRRVSAAIRLSRDSRAESAPPVAPTEDPAATTVVAMADPIVQKPAAPIDQPWRERELPRKSPVPAEERATTPPAPEPSPLTIISWIGRFFSGGNSLVRVGVVILFFGVAFLLRYMAEHSHISIQVRLTGIAVFAIVLLILGWRLRTSRSGYALALQGGAVGILYLTVFAALRLYSILPAAVAFPLLAVIAALSAVLAILQDSMWFALLSVTGGFLAPVLASSGEGSHVVLFSYYAVLNAGILAMAWFKAWRPLNIAGFAFTFAIGTAWGVLRYRPDEFASTEPFLIAFFLFYLAITILFSLRQPNSLKAFIDGTLVFGTPIIAFALQSAMLHDRLMALAFSAVAVSAVYLVIAWGLKHLRDGSQELLAEAFIALGVAFLTLAVPLALDARWSAASWAFEGASLVWIGCRQSRVLARIFGALLILASGCITTTQFDFRSGHPVLALNAYFGVILQAAAAIFAALTVNAYRTRLKTFERVLPAALFWLGLWWWAAGGISEIFQYWPAHSLAHTLIFATITALACSAVNQLTQLNAAKVAALLQFPVMVLFALIAAEHGRRPFADGGWLGWSLAFVGLYSILYSHEGLPRKGLANLLNSGSAWLVCSLLSWELAWDTEHHIARGESWPATAWVLVPAALLLFLPRLVTRVKWPFAKNRDAYLFIAGVGLALYLAVWSLATNVSQLGDSSPLPYAPFLNPLDVGQAFVLLVLWRYWRFLRAVRSPGFERIDQRLPIPILVGLGFIWLNAVLLRTLHQWFHINLDLDRIFSSTLVQTSLTIFWTVLALITMLIAARQRRRAVWLTGAVLLAIVVAKLFLVDLSRIGSIERIISFVGVGMLMLVVGYFSPMPPAKEAPR
ncbi:MAG TPA: DUF2339 domain-containing protein [Steroidobacteraceae bacterium]